MFALHFSAESDGGYASNSSGMIRRQEAFGIWVALAKRDRLAGYSVQVQRLTTETLGRVLRYVASKPNGDSVLTVTLSRDSHAS